MTELAREYGDGLYALSAEEKLCDEVLEQLASLKTCFREQPEFLKLLSNMSLGKQERIGILDNALRGQIHPYVLNFLKILTEKGYIRRFSDCCKAFRQLYNEDHGILEVFAYTAIALNEDQKQRLSQKLQAVTGKTIDLINRVDPSCLGGVRLDYDGKRVDDTVSHRLATISALLKNTVL